ncbi:MAG: hypothetical protein RQ723_10695 [Desulfuromonadales bacterium]|nr:hypothetical protein [Desulfuromonadales bacterium]
MHIGMAILWIMFLALFPMAFIWLRRAWRIFRKKDYSEVALKRGEPPPNPAKWAPVTGAVNLLAGLAALGTIFGVFLFQMPEETWTKAAGITLWGKVFADFIVSRQAHPFEFGKAKKTR